MTVHYIAFFAIVLRAQRVFKFMALEYAYLKQIYQLDDSIDEPSKERGVEKLQQSQMNHDNFEREMQQCHES
jgi:hypothetical protein